MKTLVVNTDSLVDDTNKQGQIPQSEYRREEVLRLEGAFLREQLRKKEITAKKFKEQREKIERDIAKFQENLEVQMIKQQEEIRRHHEAQQSNKTFFGKLKRIK